MAQNKGWHQGRSKPRLGWTSSRWRGLSRLWSMSAIKASSAEIWMDRVEKRCPPPKRGGMNEMKWHENMVA